MFPLITTKSEAETKKAEWQGATFWEAAQVPGAEAGNVASLCTGKMT